MKKLLVLLVVCALGVAGLKVTTSLYLGKKLTLNEKSIFEVKKGSSLTAVAAELAAQKWIVYPRLFVKVGQFYGYGESIKYGEYQLMPDDTYQDVFHKLVSGDTFKYRVTLVEGEHIYELARILFDRGLDPNGEFLKEVKNPKLIEELLGESLPSLEGYLFPDTYAFSKSDGIRKIIETMVSRFLEEIKKIDNRGSGLSRHQLVTLASIVEKETGAAFERPLISSVFHNRLKKKMRLQTDPTIIYGIMDETGREIKNIRKSDIKKPTAYNTYVINGLPPGPIGNPGFEALAAAANPKPSTFLYFVSQNDGTHIFTENYKDHLSAVKKFQMNPKMRQGKSWRDLKKKDSQ